MKKNDEKLCLTLQEASDYIGLNIKKLSKLTKEKGFPCVFVGRRTLIIKNELENWLKKNIGKYY